MRNFRQYGEKILIEAWHFICNLLEVILISYKVTLSQRNRCCGNVKNDILRYRIICAGISSISTTLITAVLLKSFIGIGFAYGIFSFQKRFAIALASEKGDWFHWMTGGIYTVFNESKELLIEHYSFAKLLSNMAENGIMFKIIQVTIILGCVTLVLIIFYLLGICICVMCENIHILLKKKINKSKRARAKK